LAITEQVADLFLGVRMDRSLMGRPSSHLALLRGRGADVARDI